MKRNKKILYSSLLLFNILLFYIIYFIHIEFKDASLEQLLFHLNVPLKNASSSFILTVINSFILCFIFIGSILIMLNYLEGKLYIDLNILKLNKTISINKVYLFLLKWGALFSLVILVFLINKWFKVCEFVTNQFVQTEIFDNYYAPLESATVTFPNDKQNLIYIIVESLESTDVSLKNGGFRNKSLIPELETLALKNINFSNTDKIGGAIPTNLTSWTMGAIVAQTSGLPLKLLSENNGNEYGQYSYILKNAYSIGDILETNGYHNYFMMGSDKAFAGRDIYLLSHGNHDIFDFNTAKEKEYIEEDYNINWWGFEDKKLYEFAKLKLKEISKNDEPFNFSLLTVDTHPFEGYLDETCDVDNNLTHFENTFKCASTMLNDFINWIKKQSFYKNTTIVITGDHLNMVTDQIYEEVSDDYIRTNYNVFINSKASADCNENRTFTSMDMFPTTLAAMGANILGERLGMGTNLFSCKETLAEQFGIDYLNQEFSKSSSFYSKCLYYGKCE